MDQHQYHAILTKSIMPELKELGSEDPAHVIWLFQQDNDSFKRSGEGVHRTI